MKTINKAIIFLMVLALTAVATPSMAIEHEFHGMFRLGMVGSNYSGSEGPDYFSYNGSGMFANTPDTGSKHRSTAFYLDQRTRIMYIAKIDEDLKLVTQFEMNARWGDTDYKGSSISGGGAVGSDSVNLRTKHVFLDYTFHPWDLDINAKLGLQYFGDNYKGVFFSNDAAAAIFSTNVGKTSVRLAFSRFADNGSTNYSGTTNYTGGSVNPYNTNGLLFGFNGTVLDADEGTVGAAYGDVSADLYMLDAKYKVNKDLTIGGSYYFLYSDIARKLYGVTESTLNGYTYHVKYRANVHMLGFNAQGRLGPVDVNGFFLYQFGKTVSKNISAFAANLGAKMKLGPGTIKAELLYMSGDDGNRDNKTNAFVAIGGECGYMVTGLQFLARDNLLISNRNSSLFYDNNAGQGMMLGWVGYDLPLTKKLTFSTNVGYGAVAKQNQNVVTSSGQNLGTEVNISFPYKARENFTIAPRFAYVFLGDFFNGLAENGQDPDDIYSASLVMLLKW